VPDDLSRLVHDLEQEAVVTAREVTKVVSKGALNIKRDWRKRAQGIAHAPRYPLSINYDLHEFSAEIGPEDSPENQGFLGPILEFGGAHNGPRNDGGQALDAEAPRFEKALHDLLGKRLT
jgi:hypothetical protein